MLDVDKAMKKERLGAKMILQVHDELVFDVPKKELDRATEVIRRSMEQVVELKVPIKVKVSTGENWYEV